MASWTIKSRNECWNCIHMKKKLDSRNEGISSYEVWCDKNEIGTLELCEFYKKKEL